jgi:hypothetical protein
MSTRDTYIKVVQKLLSHSLMNTISCSRKQSQTVLQMQYRRTALHCWIIFLLTINPPLTLCTQHSAQPNRSVTTRHYVRRLKQYIFKSQYIVVKALLEAPASTNCTATLSPFNKYSTTDAALLLESAACTSKKSGAIQHRKILIFVLA